jgi:hypothetical protein
LRLQTGRHHVELKQGGRVILVQDVDIAFGKKVDLHVCFDGEEYRECAQEMPLNVAGFAGLSAVGIGALALSAGVVLVAVTAVDNRTWYREAAIVVPDKVTGVFGDIDPDEQGQRLAVGGLLASFGFGVCIAGYVSGQISVGHPLGPEPLAVEEQ